MRETEGQTGGSWAAWASRAVIAAGLLGGIWLLFTYGLGLLAPFLVGWILSRMIRPLVKRMVGKSRMPRKLAAGLLVCLFTAGVAALLGWGFVRGLSEFGKLLEGISGESEGALFTGTEDLIDAVAARLPFLQGLARHPFFARLWQGLDDLWQQGATQILTTLGQRVPAALLSVVGSLPSVLLFVTSLLFSCYYFSADDGELWQGFLSCLSEGWRCRVERWREGVTSAAKKYVRAYLALAGITFVEMFLGLMILRVPYAFLLAWGIALIDFLPLLGTGVVLIPWSVVSLLMGDTWLGLGLLILFGVSALVRQLTEPGLLGAELGIHPLVSLFAVYAGWKLFGVWGMMLAPFGALLIKSLVWKRGGER